MVSQSYYSANTDDLRLKRQFTMYMRQETTTVQNDLAVKNLAKNITHKKDDLTVRRALANVTRFTQAT